MNERQADIVEEIARRFGISFDKASDLFMMYGTQVLDRVMLKGNRKPGDLAPVGLMSNSTRRYTTAEQREADRRATDNERARWNARVDEEKAARKARRGR